MVADAMNAPFSNIPGGGRVLEMNTTTGERGITVGSPFTDPGNPALCNGTVSCPGPFKPTGILSGGENGHAYLVSAAQHTLVEHHRDGTPIRTAPAMQTSPSPTGGGFGFVPRLLGNGFMPNGNIAQTSCDANFFNASNSDDDGEGGLLANKFFPPVNGTEERGANGRVVVLDQNTLEIIDEYSKPTSGPYANDPRWNCPAGVIFTSEGLFVSMFHGDAVFVIDWKSGIDNQKSEGVGSNSSNGFSLGDLSNEADVIRVIDLSNDGTLNTGYAPNYDDSPNFDSGHRRDNLRAIRMAEDGTLFGTRRSRSAECNEGDACNPGNFRQHIFVAAPGSNQRTGSLALDPGVNVIAGVTINRMSGPACKFVQDEVTAGKGKDKGKLTGDECDVETLYVGVSAGNAGCVLTGPVPPNPCFEPRGAAGGGGKVYEYRIDAAHLDATDGTCSGDSMGDNSGCALPIATFTWDDGDGGVETLDPRMVMTIHEAFVQ
jgi:hypothetical protein